MHGKNLQIYIYRQSSVEFSRRQGKIQTNEIQHNIFISHFIVLNSLVEDFIGHFLQFPVPGIIGSTLMGQICGLKSTFSFAESLIRIMSNYSSCEVNNNEIN